MKIIILLGSEADEYVRGQAKLAWLVEFAKSVAQKSVKLAADLKAITQKEGD